MNDLYINQNNYGQILLRDSYEAAIAESEMMYDLECERKNCPTPKSERTTQFLLGIKENVLSGQVGLCIPPFIPHVEVPSESMIAVHVDNPLWVNYEFLNGESKFVLGNLPFGQFGFGLVEPNETRKVFEGNFSPELIKQIRSSSRKYTLDVHNRCSILINEILQKKSIVEELQRQIDSDLFEELVADLLRDQGFDVFLTSRTGDGGKDIWASTFFGGKHFIALVECKIRNSKRAIDPALARAVVGTYFIEKNRGISVDCALMVTSSSNIGPETIKIEQEFREFAVKDCNDVAKWVSQYGDIKNNLWVPGALAKDLI